MNSCISLICTYRRCPSQKHKCKAAEDRCVQLEAQYRKAQAGNADLKAKVKTDEEALQHVQQEMTQVKQLHTTLQRALGETGSALEKGLHLLLQIIPPMSVTAFFGCQLA